ncbi:transient receptor potential cation channel subfamily M member 2-like, partial [Saccostrea cucullata]|uniref:transient receptor potential cation channel subfamily M member 2-like n=1 Tax=Saccostrea cuccullata TaxID=36930 RepID=UPI002ED0BA1E
EFHGKIRPFRVACNGSAFEIKKKEREIFKFMQQLSTCTDDNVDSENSKAIKEKIFQSKKDIERLNRNVAKFAEGLFRKILGYEDMEQSLRYVNGSDILLWAIFANRMEIAEISWLLIPNHLFTGIACAALLQELSKKAKEAREQNLGTDFADFARMFNERCKAMMDCMFEEDEDTAINLMDTDVTIWGLRSSPLTFAHDNFMYDIVAHNCSFGNMFKQWNKDLGTDIVSVFKSLKKNPRNFFTAPVTKYKFNYIIFFVIMVMYSAFVLTSIGDEYYSLSVAKVFEYSVYFWGAGDLIEELITMFGCPQSGRGRSQRKYFTRVKRHVNDFWNFVDFLFYGLTISALFVRHFHPSNNFTVARRLFSLSLLVMYLRFLEFFRVNQKMGPTLIMIRDMLGDLIRFLILAVFVVLGVGMYYHANLWPDHPTIWSGNWVNWRIWKIIYYPYWQLYGETNNEFLEGKDLSSCTNVTTIWENDTSIERCPKEDWTVSAISAIYMLLSNLLLVNLVIAMFSYTFERVQQNADTLWRFNAFSVINEYEWRIPSPFNLLFAYRFCCRCRAKCGVSLYRP